MIDYSKPQQKFNAWPTKPAEERELSLVGLSYAHIRPKPDRIPSFQCWPEGNLVKAVVGGKVYPAAGGGKRGAITGLSRGARRRLMYQLCMTKRESKPLFVTLTYPDLFPHSARIWKRDLKVFFQRLARAYPESSAFWRIEPKKRKSGQSKGKIAPHYHMLMWGVSLYNAIWFVKSAWWGAVGSENEDHYKAGTRVETIRSKDGVKRYASKYASKSDEEELALFMELELSGEHIGRIWGKFNEDLIPWSNCVEITPTNEEVYKLFRLMRRYAHLKMRSNTPSMTLMVADPVQWFRPIRC